MIADSGRKSVSGCDGRTFGMVESKSSTARPKRRAGGFRYLSGRPQSWRCADPPRIANGFSRHGPGADTLSRPASSASILKACAAAKVERFPLFTLRHTTLTRWASNMDPWTLSYLAGHRDMATTRRYVHPQEETIREALEKTRSGHKIGHSQESAVSDPAGNPPAINSGKKI